MSTDFEGPEYGDTRKKLFIAEALILSLYLLHNGKGASSAKPKKYVPWVKKVLGNDVNSDLVQDVLQLEPVSLAELFRKAREVSLRDSLKGIDPRSEKKTTPAKQILSFLRLFVDTNADGKTVVLDIRNEIKSIEPSAIELSEVFRKETWGPFIVSVFSPSSAAIWITNSEIDEEIDGFLIPRVWNPYGENPNVEFLKNSDYLPKRAAWGSKTRSENPGKPRRGRPAKKDKEPEPAVVAVNRPDQSTEAERIEAVLQALAKCGTSLGYLPDSDTLANVTLRSVEVWKVIPPETILRWLRTGVDDSGKIGKLVAEGSLTSDGS